jgi:hypothetical protein
LITTDQGGDGLWIQLSTLRAVGGAWAWDTGRVTASGAPSGPMTIHNPPRTKTWGNWLEGTHLEVRPFVEISLPLSDAHIHHWITLDIMMNVTYAATSYPQSGFHDAMVNLHRSVNLFVIRREDVLPVHEPAPRALLALIIGVAVVGLALVWRAHQLGCDFGRIPKGFVLFLKR